MLPKSFGMVPLTSYLKGQGVDDINNFQIKEAYWHRKAYNYVGLTLQELEASLGISRCDEKNC
jgi:hypothetical protein